MQELSREHGSRVFGCGHAGDGNIHFSVYEPDERKRSGLLQAIFEMGVSIGGAISGEHGIGRAKKRYYQALEDPAKLASSGGSRGHSTLPGCSIRAVSSTSPRRGRRRHRRGEE